MKGRTSKERDNVVSGGGNCGARANAQTRFVS